MIKDLIRKVFRPRRVIEQHIAVFGESGSGKTTLLSTFYGWHQEPFFRRTAGYSLLADDTSQGQRLLKQYFKMKESLLPPPTRYQHQAFKFNITVRGLDKSAGSIVWHDYPGEWWTETKTDAEEKKKIEAFRTLLKSDIAFFLCDAQILREEGGKYLKRLFGSFRGELERQKSAIVSDNKPLQSFPRVWVICLSKSDLMPDKDVYWFRGEIYKSAIDELEELREVLKMMLAGDDYQSIGEDFLLLSSAKFDSETGKIINPEQNIGIDLIPPISIILPIQRALIWAKVKVNRQVAIYRVAEIFRSLTTNWLKYIPLVGNVFMLVDDTAKSITDKLKDLENSARQEGNSVTAVAAAFRGKLEDEQTQKVYFSNKNEIN